MFGKSTENLNSAEDGGKGSGKGSKKPAAPPRKQSDKNKGFKGPKSNSSAAMFEASSKNRPLSGRPAGSSSIPKALNALVSEDSEEDLESTPVERKGRKSRQYKRPNGTNYCNGSDINFAKDARARGLERHKRKSLF